MELNLMDLTFVYPLHIDILEDKPRQGKINPNSYRRILEDTFLGAANPNQDKCIQMDKRCNLPDREMDCTYQDNTRQDLYSPHLDSNDQEDK
jgi:hypothetical protein